MVWRKWSRIEDLGKIRKWVVTFCVFVLCFELQWNLDDLSFNKSLEIIKWDVGYCFYGLILDWWNWLMHTSQSQDKKSTKPKKSKNQKKHT